MAAFGRLFFPAGGFLGLPGVYRQESGFSQGKSLTEKSEAIALDFTYKTM